MIKCYAKPGDTILQSKETGLTSDILIIYKALNSFKDIRNKEVFTRL